MKKTILFTLAAFLALNSVPASSPSGEISGHQKHKALSVDERIPVKAIDVFEYVFKTGKAPEGYVGGRVWQNREKRLPKGGDYREYDVNPKVRGRNRGAERIVIDFKSMKGWYTADHYRTFIPIRR